MSDPHVEPSITEPDITRPQGAPSSPAPTGAPVVSDELLLHGVRMRDEQALEQLYDRYGGSVFTLALRVVGDSNLAEDAMHDVFLRCWNGLDQFDATRGTVPAWLFGIARHRAIDVLRGHRDRAGRHERDVVTETDANTPTLPVQADEAAMRATVDQALNELPGSQREAIELSYYAGLTQSEVATRLGEPLGTVKFRIRDGLRRLRRDLAPHTERAPTPERGAS
jgi:RNA polymerase sigma-70 factor, ECF subfamily